MSRTPTHNSNSIPGAVGVGGVGAGGFWAVWARGEMEPRNTLNTRKGLNSSGLELELRMEVEDCLVCKSVTNRSDLFVTDLWG